MLSLMTDSLSSEPPEPSFPIRIKSLLSELEISYKFKDLTRPVQNLFHFSQISILYNFVTIRIYNG